MSQDLPDLFLDAGCFYIFKKSTLLKINTRKPMPKKTIEYLIDHKRAIDINYPKDLILSKKIFKKLRLNQLFNEKYLKIKLFQKLVFLTHSF